MDKKNKYTLGLYEKAMPNSMSFNEKFRICKDNNFDQIEISIDETDQKLDRLFNGFEFELKKLMMINNASIRTMCLSAHRKYPLGSHHEEIRKKSIDILKRAVQFSDTIGIRIIQLAGYDVYYEENDADTKNYFIENLKKCTDYASKYGVLLGFETMETPFMDTISKSMHYVNMINSPYLGVYPDIGNLKNACVKYGLSLENEIESGRGHIFASHLKETIPGVYRDMDFGSGHTEYELCIKKLLDQGVRIFTGEFWYKEDGDIEKISKSSVFLRNKIDKFI